MSARISLIVALSEQTRAIGKDNQLLWKISDDLKRFKALTTGHPIIMGRKTFESIGRALPNRTNIIITRNKYFKPENCVVVDSFKDALNIATKKEAETEKPEQEIFVIGGGEIYKEALPFTDRLYLTLVDSPETGDVFFPDYSEFSNVISEEKHLESSPSFRYVILEKRDF